VLVVDDDDATRYTTRRVLEKAGFTVAEAENAAGDGGERRRPDLILLDLRLPDLDGFEVCRRIKSDPGTASVRVVPFTAVFHDDSDRRRAFAVGADGYLIKPIVPEQLVATVNALIGMG
jgi:two-component system, sensor histidine kinase